MQIPMGQGDLQALFETYHTGLAQGEQTFHSEQYWLKNQPTVLGVDVLFIFAPLAHPSYVTKRQPQV